MDESDLQQQLQWISEQLNSNSDNAELILQKIAVLRSLDLKEQISESFGHLASLLPLSEDLWAIYISNELALAEEPEDYEDIAELYISALRCFRSFNLVVSFLEYLSSLSPHMVIPLMETIELVVFRQALDIENGHSVWISYFKFLKQLAANPLATEFSEDDLISKISNIVPSVLSVIPLF
ncbi:hypothetical protein GEMRC1_007427 [Eukaryota sp. GEM-RC1]